MKDEKENIPGNDGADNFSVPENYFRNSASAIFNKIEWQEEHSVFPELLALKGRTNSGNGFSIPENYFSQKEIFIEKLQYPLLQKINKDENFSVPKSYFEKNQTKLVSLIERPKETKVIPLFRKRFSVSVAALFLISLGFWIYTSYFKSNSVEDCGTLACIEKEELIKSINLENYENEDLYELVSESDLLDNQALDHESGAQQKYRDSGSNTIQQELNKNRIQ